MVQQLLAILFLTQRAYFEALQGGMENESQTFLILSVITTVKGQLEQRTAILMFDDDTHLPNEIHNSLLLTKCCILK